MDDKPKVKLLKNVGPNQYWIEHWLPRIVSTIWAKDVKNALEIDKKYVVGTNVVGVEKMTR